MLLKPKDILIAIGLLVLTVPYTASGQTDNITALRNENVRLRIQIRDLSEELDALKRNGVDNVGTGARKEERKYTFYSVLDQWDELSGEDDILERTERGLVSVEAIDTLLCIPFDSSVQKYIDIYTIVKKDNMRSILQRYDQYLPMFKEIFTRYGIPVEFSLLSVVESAVNANAVSRVGAAGMWQMMPDAASDYGLDLSPANDERFDPRKSTVAAVRFLADRYREFGDWALALMAYNYGPGNVRRVVDACRGTMTYDYLYGALPRETRDYLPALVAAMYVNRNRKLIFEEELLTH